jgi:L-iditol 2-dehydrogenase
MQRGCNVVGIDLIPYRCEVSRSCGIRALCVTQENMVEQVRSIFDGKGANTVVEATGHPQAVTTGLQMTAPLGEMILLGSTRGKIELDVYSLIHAPAVTVRGAHEKVCKMAGGPTRPRELLQEHLNHIAAGRLVIKPLLTEVVNFKQLGDAYHRLSKHQADTIALELEWPE